MKEKHPKLQLKRDPRESKLNMISLIIGILMTAYVVYIWFDLPDKMPIHFDLDGRATGWGGPGTLTTLSCIALIQALVSLFLQKYPHAFSYLVKIHEGNAERQYNLAIVFLQWISFLSTLLIAWVIYVLSQVALYGATGRSLCYAPWFLGAYVLGTALYLLLSWYKR